MVLAVSLVLGFTPAMGETYAAKKMALNKKKITLQVGASAKLKVKNARKKVTWKTSNKKVVKVSKAGKVVALRKGNAKITAKVAGKKFICKVKVVPKNKLATTTEAATTPPANNEKNTPTPATPGNMVIPGPGNNNNNKPGWDHQDDGNKDHDDNKDDNTDEDNRNDTEEGEKLDLSKITFDNNGYSMRSFIVSYSVNVEDYTGFPLSVDADEDGENDSCKGFTFVNDFGEEYISYWMSKADTPSGGHTLQGTISLPLGHYIVLYNGFYCGTVTEQDFSNMIYNSKLQYKKNKYFADLDLGTIRMESVAGTLTVGGNVFPDSYVTVTQNVDGKEYSSSVNVDKDGNYTLYLPEGYDYKVLPMGLKREAISVSVKGGKAEPSSIQTNVSTSLQTVLVNLEGFENNSWDDINYNEIELRSDSVIAKLQCPGHYDEDDDWVIDEYKIIAPSGTYDVYCNGYLIQKNVVITENMEELTISQPQFHVSLKQNGEKVSLSEYVIRKVGEMTDVSIPDDGVFVDLVAGDYQIYQHGCNQFGEMTVGTSIGTYRVDASSADENGNIVLNISTAAVSLKNFDRDLMIGDYIIEDVWGNEIEVAAGAASVNLCAGTYALYEETDAETMNKLETFQVTLKEAKAGTAIWNLELATVTGKVQIPAGTSEWSKDSAFVVNVYKKGDRTKEIAEFPLENVTEVEGVYDPDNYRRGYYEADYSVKLKKGEYRFEVTTGLRVIYYANVQVEEAEVERELIGVYANIKVICPEGLDRNNIYVAMYDGEISYYSTIILKDFYGAYYFSYYLDRDSVYSIYVKDSAGKRKLVTDTYCYGTEENDTISLEGTLSNIYTYELPFTRDDISNLHMSDQVTVEDIQKGGNFPNAFERSIYSVNGKYVVNLFDEGTYAIFYGNSSAALTAVGTLTLSNGIFTFQTVE